MDADKATVFSESIHSMYGLEVDSLERIEQGLGTTNWRLKTSDADYFVKQYHPSADPARERDALRLAGYAHSYGIPTPRIVPAKTGELLTVGPNIVFSVFEYIPSATSGGSLTHEQMSEAGATLGAIHDLFEGLTPAYPAITDEWLRFDPIDKKITFDQLLAVISRKPEKDEFDYLAEETIHKRKELLAQVPAMIKGFQELHTQVIHNDYSSPNLLFRGQHLVGVVDFQPSEPFLVSYEIGRMALNVETLRLPGWFESSVAFVDAYCNAKTVAARDVVMAPRVWFVQLVRSTYGVRNHYLHPHEFQPDLDRFWLDRSHACEVILANIVNLEEAYLATWEVSH